jgi:hypothetical protein
MLYIKPILWLIRGNLRPVGVNCSYVQIPLEHCRFLSDMCDKYNNQISVVF